MDEPSITLHIKFGGDSLQAALPSTASVKDLKAHLQFLTNVLPRGQKLIFKGKILEDSVTLKAANLSDGSKIMLMASHGVHQGGGPIKKDSPQSVPRKGLEAKPTIKPNLDKAKDITRLQRWKATGVISLSESGLEQLNLAHNNLTSIPEEIGQLQQLQILKLNNNCLKVLPLTIGHCCSLLEADFSSNLLGEVPSTLGNLQNIKDNDRILWAEGKYHSGEDLGQVLQLGNNGLRSFPTNVLKDCSQLSTLDLHANEVTIEDLREVEGWAEFDERRRSKHSKQIEFSVMGSSGFDEGADSQHWNQW